MATTTTRQTAEVRQEVVGEVVRLLSHHTDRGQAYRIDLRLRPEGHRGPLARSLASTLAYYDINALSNFVADAVNVVSGETTVASAAPARMLAARVSVPR